MAHLKISWMLFVVALLGTIAGCGTDHALSKSESLARKGDYAQSVDVLRERMAKDPDNIELRAAYFSKVETLVARYSRQADDALTAGDDETAISLLQSILEYDPANIGAQQEINRIHALRRLRPMLEQANSLRDTDSQQALRIVQNILAEEPNLVDAQELRDTLIQRSQSVGLIEHQVGAALRKPVSVNFHSQPLASTFKTLSELSGVNFVLDKDISPTATISFSAARTTVEDAVNLITLTNQLHKQMLNADTMLIYPARPDKDREYRELAVRTFFLSYSDPKLVANQLKQLLNPKDIYIDERLNAVVVRDGTDTLSAVERMVQALDLPPAEVTLDVQVLEVNRSDLLNLGIGYPSGVNVGLSSAINPVEGIPLGNLRGINKDNILIDVGSAKVTLNMLQRSANTQTLANPKIRVRNREKATINIGERVPVVSNTVSNGVVSASVTYQDVGLKLEVEPNISLSNEIAIKLALDVSNILETRETNDGLITYVLGTRSAKTTLTARNNETQVLAGLIRRSDFSSAEGLPFLSKTPLLGRLFGSNKNTQEQVEIVLLITPRIERNLNLPAAQVTTFLSGTEARAKTQPLILNGSRKFHLINNPDPTGTVAPSNASLPPPLSVPNGANWQPLPPPGGQSVGAVPQGVPPVNAVPRPRTNASPPDQLEAEPERLGEPHGSGP
ncbi:secretin N-terminal domain-containing protein [Burkholderia sp. AW49-1]